MNCHELEVLVSSLGTDRESSLHNRVNTGSSNPYSLVLERNQLFSEVKRSERKADVVLVVVRVAEYHSSLPEQ